MTSGGGIAHGKPCELGGASSPAEGEGEIWTLTSPIGSLGGGEEGRGRASQGLQSLPQVGFLLLLSWEEQREGEVDNCLTTTA